MIKIFKDIKRFATKMESSKGYKDTKIGIKLF
jgi:hypothetical protein